MQDLGGKNHITRLVNSVYIPEGCSHGKMIAHLAELLVGIGHFLGLGIQLGTVYIGIVNAVFLTSGNSEFNFQGHAHFTHALQVGFAGLDVLFQGFFRKVQHM